MKRFFSLILLRSTSEFVFQKQLGKNIHLVSHTAHHFNIHFIRFVKKNSSLAVRLFGLPANSCYFDY